MKTDSELRRDVERELEWEPSVDERRIGVSVVDGIVTLTLDDPAQKANTMNATYVAAMTAAMDRLEAEKAIATRLCSTATAMSCAGTAFASTERASTAALAAVPDTR